MNTGERLMKIETDITYLKKGQDELKETMENFIDSADKKYATKLTEKIVYGICFLILTAFVTLIIYRIGWGG